MSQIIIWSLVLLIPTLLIILVNQIIAPFIISLIIAYLLNPSVDRLSKMRIPRSLSTLSLTSLFFSIILAFLFFIVPLLYSQLTTVLNVLPDYLSFLQKNIYSDVFGHEINHEDIQSLVKKYFNGILNIITKFANNLWSSTIAMINIVSLIFITPVITFYTLRDWPLIVNFADKIIPRKHYKVITEQISKIDKILSAYMRGQAQVCLLLGLFYATCLYFAGLQYSLFIGFFTGIFSFIPYIGFALGFIIGNIVSFFQFDSLLMKAIIILIFVVGQVLESSIITPKLIGGNVKLHPVWIIFAIFVGGALFGFIGVLVAIPIAAIIGVLIRFFLGHYFKSHFYETTQFTK